VIYLLRHAKAGRRGACGSRDTLRPLDSKGRQQAIALCELLDDVPLDVILSSPFVRCMETVIPIAARRMLPIEPHPALRESTPLPLVLDLVREHANRSVLLCTHGDVIGDVLGHLESAGWLDPGMLDLPIAKGSTWVLRHRSDGTLAATEYRPAP
jgi:8-oxo-dGTP diphosphatase